MNTRPDATSHNCFRAAVCANYSPGSPLPLLLTLFLFFYFLSPAVLSLSLSLGIPLRGLRLYSWTMTISLLHTHLIEIKRRDGTKVPEESWIKNVDMNAIAEIVQVIKAGFSEFYSQRLTIITDTILPTTPKDMPKWFEIHERRCVWHVIPSSHCLRSFHSLPIRQRKSPHVLLISLKNAECVHCSLKYWQSDITRESISRAQTPRSEMDHSCWCVF